MLLQPKEITIEGQDGAARVYVLSKVPAVPMREIIAKYGLGNIPKIGSYEVSEEIMLKLMAFVGVPRAGQNGEALAPLQMSSKELVNNHVPDWEALGKLEYAMLDYNCSFFGSGKALALLQKLGQKARPWLTETLTGLLEQSLRAGRQP